MMFKLYGNIDGWKLLYEDKEEQKIKHVLAMYFMKYDHIEYIIKQVLPDRDNGYKRTNEEDINRHR